MKKALMIFVSLSLFVPIISSNATNGKVEARVGSKTIKICDKGYKLDVAPFQDGSTVYLPLRFFADRLGADVGWDADKKIASIIGFGVNFSVDFKLGRMTNNDSPISTGEKPKIVSQRGFIGSKSADIVFKMGFSLNNKNIVSNIDCERIKYSWTDFNLPVDKSKNKDYVKLSQVLNNGKTKVLILEFWYTQCTHCWDQLKHLEILYQKYKDKGLEIFSISTDGPDNEVSRWEKVEELGYTYMTLLDSNSEAYSSYLQPNFPNITVIVPNEKYISFKRDPVSKEDNDELEKLIESLCTSN